MLSPSYTRQFKKDLKKLEKSGNKDTAKLKTVLKLLIDERPLLAACRDHPLSGKYKGRRECHIEPDWLLVYKLDKKAGEVVFERTGSHSDLFQ